jgi:hypothetical protein
MHPKPRIPIHRVQDRETSPRCGSMLDQWLDRMEREIDNRMQRGPGWTEIPRILPHCRETLHRETDPMRQTPAARTWIPPRAGKAVPYRGGSRQGRAKLSGFCRMPAQSCAECSRGGVVLSGSQETARAHCGNVSIRRANIRIRCSNVWIVLADASLCRVAWVSLAAPRARVDGDDRTLKPSRFRAAIPSAAAIAPERVVMQGMSRAGKPTGRPRAPGPRAGRGRRRGAGRRRR